MAQLRRHLTRLMLGLALLLTGAKAASSQSSPKDESRLQVVALADFTGRDQLYYLRSATDAVAIDIPVLQRSPSLTPKSLTAPIVFAIKKTDPATGNEIYQPVLQANWPAGSPDRAIVFIAVGQDGKVGAVSVDDSLKTFPVRTLRVINFAGSDLLAKFGTFQGTVTPGPQAAVSYPKVNTPAGTVGRFRVGIARQDEAGNTKIIFNGWTEAWPNARTILLIKQEGPRTQVRALVETLPEPTP